MSLEDKQTVRGALGTYPKFWALPRYQCEVMARSYRSDERHRSKVSAKHCGKPASKVNLYTHRKGALGTYSGGNASAIRICTGLIGSPSLINCRWNYRGLDPSSETDFTICLSEMEKIRRDLSTISWKMWIRLCSIWRSSAKARYDCKERPCRRNAHPYKEESYQRRSRKSDWWV